LQHNRVGRAFARPRVALDPFPAQISTLDGRPSSWSAGAAGSRTAGSRTAGYAARRSSVLARSPPDGPGATST